MSIALNKKSQAQFSNAVSNIKKFLKEGKLKVKETGRKKRPQRGVVYLSHIPHGFYENEMKIYFSQFGKVLRVRLMRSKKTGASKGHAFIQFLHPEVAKIVAETMNNYLMCNRLLKAEYMPPERQNPELFRGREWNKTFYPKLFDRKRTIRQKNTDQSITKYQKFVQKEIKKVEFTKKVLRGYGIEYDFKFSNVPNDIKIEEFLSNKSEENDVLSNRSEENDENKNDDKKEKSPKGDKVKTKSSKTKKENVFKSVSKKNLLDIDSNQVQLRSVKSLRKLK